MKEFGKMLGQRINNARKNLGMTMKELGLKVGLHESTIQRYEIGEIKKLDIEKIKEFALALDVSPAYLLGWDEPCSIKTKQIPIVGQIAAGTPILAEENIDDYFAIDSRINADFALVVKGDSMIDAGIFENDMVFIKQQHDLANGQIGAILIEGEATLKRFYRTNGGIILQSENKNHPPRTLTNGNVKILGKLCAVLNIGN